ncbi:hypothetical protein RB608_12605 [Nocardioides sp. LHD-245]|uniref:hypothetical protein n=1 Tax=Nocardioides sp. LHD-245 TaxID=3051387 RepID=UPI0027DFE4C6|nr:hypothetical protein [Nocardioides sp. LHD-245]
MTRTRLPSLASAAVLVAALACLSGCGTDEDGPQEAVSSNNSTGGADGSQSLGEDIEDALDAVGEDGVLEITAEQLVGVFGLTDYEIDDGRLVMLSEQDKDQAEAQCLQAGLVLDGVGSDAPLSIRYDDTTVNCEDFS